MSIKSVVSRLTPSTRSSSPELSAARSEGDIRARAASQSTYLGESATILKQTVSNCEGSPSPRFSLTSPCFFHRRFVDAVDVDKVLEEIAGDESMSHSKLVQTATGVREVSKQLQRRPIKRAVRNIMIITKARDNSLVKLTRELAKWLIETPRYGQSHGVTVYVDNKLRNSRRFDSAGLVAKDPKFEKMLQYWTPDLCWNQAERFDLVVTLGGDGTVLFTSWLFQRVVPPILSFSLGSLGFLTPFNFAQYRASLDHVMGGTSSASTQGSPRKLSPISSNDVVSDAGMRVNLRMRFTCTVFRASLEKGNPNASQESSFEVLNELVIDRGPSPYVSNLELFGDDSLVTVIQADGVIFSTPTGSTAYSLSAGGSLVHPDIPAILLTPICPHTLSFRPMLLNDTMALRIAVPRNSRATAYCSFDGKSRIELRQGDYVTIAASKYPFPTVVGGQTEWIDSVSRTLRWNTREARQKSWSGKSGGNFDLVDRAKLKPSRMASVAALDVVPERSSRDSNGAFDGRYESSEDAESDENEDDEEGVFDIDIDDHHEPPVDSKDSGYSEGDDSTSVRSMNMQAGS
ncbi:MAG: NAD(+) kinase [Alyxoria varia]|nr:MAG: NAD(+) kinase [Alyxoria varia]